jgi:hypothetical protein
VSRAFKTNIDVVMSLLERNGLGDWLADRLVEIGDTIKDDEAKHFDGGRFDVAHDPFLDDRLMVKNLQGDPQKITAQLVDRNG